MRIVWTAKAKISFSKILDYLHKNWTEKEINIFTLDTKETISQIQQNPYMFVASERKNEIRKEFLNRKVSLFYKINKQKEEIILLLFWDNRQNPEKLKY